MTNTPSITLYDHIRLLNSALWLFQCQPTEQHRAALLATLDEYQQAAAQGLAISHSIPPPLDPADNLSEYRRRELNEAMIQFKANPERGFEMLDSLMGDYMDGVKAGKIRL